MKEIYRGFLIENYSSTSEDRDDWGERNGTYSTCYGLEATNLKTLKSFSKSDVTLDEMKLEIDKLFSKDAKWAARKVILANANLKRYEEMIALKVQKLQESVYKKRRDVRDYVESLKKDVPPNLY